MRRSSVAVLICSFLFMVGCTSMCGSSRANLTPDQVVENYLNISLNMKKPSEKEKLLDLTTGNLKAAISEASDEDILNNMIKKSYRLMSYSVTERKNRTPREVEIAFTIEYKEMNPDDASITEANAPVIETKNTVAVIKEKGSWYIRDVLGKSTRIDFPVEAEVIKPSNPPTEDPPTVEFD